MLSLDPKDKTINTFVLDELFPFLYVHKVGSDTGPKGFMTEILGGPSASAGSASSSSLLYMCWASALERCKRFEDCEKLYQKWTQACGQDDK